VNGIKRGDEFRIELKSIRLNELKRIIRLGFNINADNLEPGATIPNPGTASATKQV